MPAAASVTTWNRIEPRVRSDSLGSLAARVHDPMWLLARQWQLGEFAAEDAGSPVSVTLQGSLGALTHVAVGAARPGVPYSADSAPLEAVLEAEATPALSSTPLDATDLRRSAQAGLWWWEVLDELGLGSLRAQYLALFPLPALPADADAASTRTDTVLRARVCDGVAVAAALSKALATGSLPSNPPFPAAQLPAAQAFVTRLAGLEATTSQSAWATDRLEYRAAVAGTIDGNEHALSIPEHRGGALDWYAFDLDPTGGVIPAGGGGTGGSGTAGSNGALAPKPFPRSFVPQPARFPGMPRARYWEFEDGNTNFGAIESATTDLTRLLLIEYALVFGNDYFVVPLSLPLGSLCQIKQVVVTDTFGGTWSIPAAGQTVVPGGFSLFTHAPPDAAIKTPTPQVLLVPPSAATARAGRPLERVRFVRDEPAELAWGVEEMVEGPLGRPIQRSELQREHRQAQLVQNPPAPPTGEEALSYALITPPPAWWLPLVPQQTGTIAFALQVSELPDPDHPGATLGPLGRVLVPGAQLADEEVPRSGVDVERVVRRARWIGGSTVVWRARRTRPGRAEGSSGLSWDTVTPTP
jgi:hypothetical protein